MQAAMAHRGPHGRTTLAAENVLLGHVHFWGTPEEVGEEQPLRFEEAGFDLAFDGRLDNRDGLISQLSPPDGCAVSDAVLAGLAYARWGEACVSRFLGPFALIVVDHRRRRVVAARDPLGDRTLVYVVHPELVLMASEEHALLQHPRVSPDLNERTLAAYLAVLPPADGETFFADIAELPPGHLLAVEDEMVRVSRYWELEPAPMGYRHDLDYVDHFRELLDLAVRCRLRSSTRCAVLMSGGLDSTSVAARAAAVPSVSGSPLVVSWVFEELAGADERRFITPVVERAGLEAVTISGDDAWPLAGDDTWADDPNGPAESPARILRQRTQEKLAAAGCRTLLSGDGGDHLFFGSEYWLRSRLNEQGIGAVLAGLASHLRRHGVRRHPARALFRALSLVLGVRRPGWSSGPGRPWLTAHARSLLEARLHSSHSPAGAEWAARRRVATDGRMSSGIRADRRAFLAGGLDHRRPFRDRRLVEFVAGLPARLLHAPGESKLLLRRAMQGSLPEVVRTRRWVSSHLPLVARGLADREFCRVQELLTASEAVWPRYVESEALWRGFPGRLATGRDGAETVVAWHCLCLELWLRRRVAGRGGVDAAARAA